MGQSISPWLIFICGQLERGNEGNIHFQGYLEVKTEVSIVELKTKLAVIIGECAAGIHYEVALGTRAENIAYCSKEETQLKFGDSAKKMLWLDQESEEVLNDNAGDGANEDDGVDEDDGEQVSAADANKKKIIDYVLANAHYFALASDMAQYAYNDRTLGGISLRIRAFNYITQRKACIQEIAEVKAKRMNPLPHYRQVENYVIWGTPGCGKTFAVTNTLEKKGITYHMHTMSQGHWFDGYMDRATGMGARVLIFDDFGISGKNGDMPLAIGDMLPIMQGYKHRVQIKGGMSELIHSMVIFISNKDPETWYNQWKIPSVEEKEAFFSRIPIGHRIHVTGGNLRTLPQAKISTIVNSEQSLAKVLESRVMEWCMTSFPDTQQEEVIVRDIDVEQDPHPTRRIEAVSSSSSS